MTDGWTSGQDPRRRPPPPSVSVVIPALDAAATLDEQLQAVTDQEYEGRVEVIVADNGSRDDTRVIVRRWQSDHGRLRLVDATDRRGPSAARNRGAAAATGEILLFCDADDRVQPGWMAALVEALADGDVVAALTGEAAPATPAQGLSSFPFLPWAGGGQLGMRRAAFLEHGGFDESLQVGEDVELCWRLQLQGLRFAFEPRARVWHRSPSSMAAAFRRDLRFGQQARHLYRRFEPFGARWPGPRRSVPAVLRLLRDAPRELSSPTRRIAWVARLGGQCGRILGGLAGTPAAMTAAPEHAEGRR